MIKDVRAQLIRDSRGEKTIRVFVKTERGIYSAASPSGKSRGKHEAKTVPAPIALKQLSKLKRRLFGQDEKKLSSTDSILKSFPANLSTAASMACWRAVFNNKVYEFGKVREFPFPLGNVIGGGAHGGTTAIQEFLVIPKKARTMIEAVRTNFSIWVEVGKILFSKRYTHGRNDEGAWTSKLNDLKTLDLLSNVAEQHDAVVGLDFASSQFYKNNSYFYKDLGIKLDRGEQIDFVKNLIKTYKLGYVEDPFHQEDWKSFEELTRKVKCYVVGDDLYATQPNRVSKGVTSGVIIKIDQAGTVSKALEAAKIAKTKRMIRIVSHRSGETLDNFISDFSVAIGSELIKCGTAGKERMAKLNRLMEIWQHVEKPRMKKIKL